MYVSQSQQCYFIFISECVINLDVCSLQIFQMLDTVGTAGTSTVVTPVLFSYLSNTLRVTWTKGMATNTLKYQQEQAGDNCV